MQVQISRFSPHQTAKVFAILMALSSLIFMLPFALMTYMMPGPMDASGHPVNVTFPFGTMAIFMPIAQGIMGYLMVLFGTWLYNKLYTSIGGIEFELNERNA